MPDSISVLVPWKTTWDTFFTIPSTVRLFLNRHTMDSCDVGGERVHNEVNPWERLLFFYRHLHAVFADPKSIWNIGGPHKYSMNDWILWIIFGVHRSCPGKQLVGRWEKPSTASRRGLGLSSVTPGCDCLLGLPLHTAPPVWNTGPPQSRRKFKVVQDTHIQAVPLCMDPSSAGMELCRAGGLPVLHGARGGTSAWTYSLF